MLIFRVDSVLAVVLTTVVLTVVLMTVVWTVELMTVVLTIVLTTVMLKNTMYYLGFNAYGNNSTPKTTV